MLPTNFYFELGGEALRGSRFPASSGKTIGSFNLFTKLGGDLNEEHSWQWGASWLHTTNDPGHCSGHDHDEEDDDEDHHHFEFCQFDGHRDLIATDLTWKWAPDGNYKNRHLTLQGEYYWMRDKGRFIDDDENHAVNALSHGGYLAAVYQWHPQWQTGLRYSRLDPSKFYGTDNPQAADLMIQWSHSHFSRVRLQYSRVMDQPGHDNIFSIQYTLTLGDHSAHLF